MKKTERGIVLPVVLLCVLGLGALSTASLVIIRSELVADRAGHRNLRELAGAERLLNRDPASPEGGFDWYVTEMRHGFRLVEVRPRGPGLSHFGIEWVLDADSVMAELPRALGASGALPTEGVEPLDGCVVPASGALTVAGDPPLDADGRPTGSPRLGLLRIQGLLALPGSSDLSGAGLFPAAPETGITRAPGPTFAVQGGEGRGILVAAGDLTLEGSAVFRGLVVVAGNLTLRESARVEGVALAGGEAQLLDGAKILGCPDLALEALRDPATARSHALPDGASLGRH